MRRPRTVLFRGAALVAVIAVAMVVGANAIRSQPPEAVALDYGRALYASEADALWRLLSNADRRAKDEATTVGKSVVNERARRDQPRRVRDQAP